MANLVAVSGELYYFEKEQLVWGVLLRDSGNDRKWLKLYKDQLEILPLHSILLDDAVSVEQSATHDTPSFKISSAEGKYNFSVESDEVRSLWLSKLNNLILPNNEENHSITYNFHVKVQPSAFAKKLDLNGEYLLKIFPSGMALYNDTGTTPSAYSCFLHDIVKTDYAHEDGLDLISIMQTCEDSKDTLKLCSTDGLDIIHIIESRRQTTKLNLTRKPAIRSKSELNKKAILKKRRSKSDLDISSSSGDFESIGSWVNWKAQRNSKRISTPDKLIGISRMPARKGAMRYSKSDSLPPNLDSVVERNVNPIEAKKGAMKYSKSDTKLVERNVEVGVNPSYSVLSTSAIQAKHKDDWEDDWEDSGYDYVKDFPPTYSTTTPPNMEESSFEYDYVRDFNAVIAERVAKKSPISYSSSEEDDYYY